MKALVKKKAEPGLWMEEVAVPEVGPNDVLIRVRKAAICGTDIHIYSWDEWSQKTVPVPITVGHEFTGEVARLGSAVTGFTKGERVSAEGHITCGHCRNCRAGKRHLCRNTVGIGVHRDVLHPQARLPLRLHQGFHRPMTPSSRPTLTKASTARSRWRRSWAALIWVRMRACPCGTTG